MAFSLDLSTPRWIRHSSISPDGKSIAFSYQGDIFTVPSTGGQALQITANEAYDSDPVWSADGQCIVFTSYRENSKDLWKVPSKGGTPARLTTFSGSESLLTVSADGFAWFTANIQHDAVYSGFPGSGQLYKVSLDGGNPVQVLPFEVNSLAVSADGSTILYEDIKGVEDDLRKHHTSSVTHDIWQYSNGKFKKLTLFNGEDRNPVLCGEGFFYLSEQDGNFNVYEGRCGISGKGERVTSLPTHPVRFLSAAKDGTLAFSYNGDLYTCRKGSNPRKVQISIFKDRMKQDVVRRSALGGAKSFDLSPDGKEAAVVSHGDVYVTLADYSQTHRITETPEQERGVSFSNDGRSIYYASERNGFWGIYKTELTDKKDKYFSLTYNYKETLFTKEGETCFQPKVSPDGKWVAFLRDRTELVIKSTSSGEERSLLKGANYSYADGDQEFEWSPDSRWLLSAYLGNGGWHKQDIALVSIDGKQITDLTQSGYADENFRWALGGKAITWNSDRDGYRNHASHGTESDVYIMFLDGKAFSDFKRSKDDTEIQEMLDGKKKKEKTDTTKTEKKPARLEFDLENRFDRIIRLSANSGRMGDHYLSKDGKKLLYTVRLEKSYDLVCRDMKDGSVKVVQKGVRGGFVPSRDGKHIYVVGGLGISKIDAATGKSSGSISFRGEYDYDAARERAYIFSHCWKQVKEKFYDKDIHGIDWDAFRDNYAQFLPYIDNNFDFRELLSEMLGELNASHTGARYRSSVSLFYAPAGHLGVLYEGASGSKGLKISEILPGSILKAAMPELENGDRILTINGKTIPEGTMWYDALAQTSGKRTELGILHGGKTQTVFIKPVSNDNAALYTRWVRRNEQTVERLSGGRIGYVHVKKMDSDSFREVYSKALGKYRDCEALIVDSRHNHGGWLHEDLVNFLSGRAYTEMRPRGQYIGTEPFGKWLKPSCVLIGEDNYSDACGFPYIYRTLGLGELIGAPVPGTMTAVWWETQVDQTLVFGIPQVTCWGIREDRALENYQIEPDILIYNNPAEEIKGRDEQLEKAVARMLGK